MLVSLLVSRIHYGDVKGAMAEPFVGKSAASASTAPQGWAFCNGQVQPISRERSVVHSDRHHLWRRRCEHVCTAQPAEPRADPPELAGNNYILGQISGVETVTVTTQELPAHTCNNSDQQCCDTNGP